MIQVDFSMVGYVMEITPKTKGKIPPDQDQNQSTIQELT